MIRLSKFFTKKADSNPNPIQPKFDSRSKRTSIKDLEDEDLQEDPEKQKARHRLIGATVLVLIAIVGLPKVFDSAPKKVQNDVVLQMVSSPVEPNKAPFKDNGSNDLSPELNDKAKDSAPTVAIPKSISPAPEKLTEKVIDKVVVKDQPKAEQVKDDVSKAADKKTSSASDKSLAKGEEVVEDVAKVKKAPPIVSTKYIVQIGAFSSTDRVKKWTAKLKEQKISFFTEEKKKDNETLHLLRAGPFSDKIAADAAEKKIRSLGLNPRVVEVK